ncbi:unnamed protein product [Allacma fusca]|uniref:Uncharacterized protein n=1 Tax=Allacma fusca TaxID=39272 RepID=A0A8J2JX28_9HEXA|nr:unnamed protein product [Allacma fusca]
MCLYNNYFCFNAHADVTSAISNYLQEGEEDNHKKFDWRRVSIQEVVALALPFIYVAIFVLTTCISLYDPYATYMTYGAISPEWRTWLVITTLILIDVVAGLVCVLPLLMIAFNTLLFFEKCLQHISTCMRLINENLCNSFELEQVKEEGCDGFEEVRKLPSRLQKNEINTVVCH